MAERNELPAHTLVATMVFVECGPLQHLSTLGRSIINNNAMAVRILGLNPGMDKVAGLQDCGGARRLEAEPR